MRAALLPTPGDPFMLAYWLRNFETWRDQVDELLVYVNGAKPEDAAYCREIIEAAGGKMHYTGWTAGHPEALAWLVQNTQADMVVLCEDDAYVRKPWAVNSAFRHIEDGLTDIVGSPRQEDYAGQFEEWPPFDPNDVHELRRGLWPTFLFIRRADLLATGCDFAEYAGGIGMPIRGLGRNVTPEDVAYINVAPDYIHLDTFWPATFMLRGRGLRIELVHHVRVYDPNAVDAWVEDDPPWFHVTNLSTLHEVLSGRLPTVDMDEHGGHWTRRMAWWVRTLDPSVPGYEQRVEQYASFIERSGMRVEDLRTWQQRFDRWVA